MQIARGQRSDLVEDLGEDLSRPHNSLGVKNSIELNMNFHSYWVNNFKSEVYYFEQLKFQDLNKVKIFWEFDR